MGRIPYDQPDTTPENQLVEMVYRFKRESEQSEKRREARNWWEESDRLIRGEHWHGLDKFKADWQQKLIINKVYPIWEKAVSMQVEGLPHLEIVPRMPHHDTFSEEVDNFVRYEWDRNGWTAVIASVLKKVVPHTVGFIKVYWDRHGDGGRGCVKLEPISNYDLFLPENATIRDGKLVAKTRIHRFHMTRAEILSAYQRDPEGEYDDAMAGRHNLAQNNAQRPPMNKPGMSSLQTDNELNIGTSYYPGTGGGVSGMSGEARSDSAPVRKDGYEVLECHYYDDTRVEYPNFDDALAVEPELKYPHGRIITVANGRLLLDIPNPLSFDPLVPLSDDPDMDSIYNPSVINQLQQPQMELNKLRSQVCDHNELCANPIMAIDSNANLTQDTVTNQPGQRIVVRFMPNGNPGVVWIEPPRMSSEVFTGIGMAEQDMDEISGHHEVNRGEEPSDRASGIAIQALQSEGRTRANLRGMFLDEGIKTIVRNVISCYVDFVTEDRKFKFRDPSSLDMQWGSFDPQAQIMPARELELLPFREQIQDLQGELINAEMVGGATPDIVQDIDSKIKMLEERIRLIQEMPGHEFVQFDIAIQTGTRNLTQQAQSAMAIQLFELGILPRQTVLQSLDWPGWQKALMLKMQEEEAVAKAQAEAETLAFERELALEREKNKMRAQNQSSSNSSKSKKSSQSSSKKK